MPYNKMLNSTLSVFFCLYFVFLVYVVFVVFDCFWLSIPVQSIASKDSSPK